MSEKIIIFGIHAVSALINQHPERIIHLSILKERQDIKIQSLLDSAKKNKIKIEFVTKNFLDQLTHQANHQGIAATCYPMKKYDEADLEKILKNIAGPPLLLILDGIQDPHNLGACLRSADAAGVHAVIAPKDKSVGLTSTVFKSASGAVENIPFIQVTNLARTLRFLKENDIWIIGTDADAKQHYYQADLTLPTAIVLGAEGHGLRRLTREHCDFLINIPMFGSVESLNVSVAAGVLLFETVRQRLVSGVK